MPNANMVFVVDKFLASEVSQYESMGDILYAFSGAMDALKESNYDIRTFVIKIDAIFTKWDDLMEEYWSIQNVK